MIIRQYTILAIVIICGSFSSLVQARRSKLQVASKNDDKDSVAARKDEEDSVAISPKCAAVIVSGGTAVGAGVTYALTPTALCTAGFCPSGIAPSSFASWWQSTMPLVKGGSIFATLQSVAMGGVSTKVVVTGSVFGGALSKKYLKQLCGYVDDPNSRMAPVFDKTLDIVVGVNTATATISTSISSVWNYNISDGVGQTVEAISTTTEIWSLEYEIESLNEQIKHLKESTYSGQMIEHVRDNTWSLAVLNFLSGGNIDEILTLEKLRADKKARLLELMPVSD